MELIKEKVNNYLNKFKLKIFNLKNITFEKWQILAVVLFAITIVIGGVYLYFSSKPKLFESGLYVQNLSQINKNQNEIKNENNKNFQESESKSENNKYFIGNEVTSLNQNNFDYSIDEENTLFSVNDNYLSDGNNYEELKNKEIVVHVCGEVKYPGVYYLKYGQRVYDAIQKAGGATKDADIHLMNLAQILYDEGRVYIPKKGEFISTNSFGLTPISNQKMNINRADSSTLQKLPGIGPTLAQRIIDYRKKIGRFKSIEQLLNVKGIGPSKFNDIKDKIRV
jgi:competence protein ComEA